ncbi:MAG: hypothetical protein HGA45_07655 [Chloroflexales bacterium]|nr:hypothetical protein [Chloroflexales bacterium]
MKVKISSILPLDHGYGECVVLEVLNDTDIGKYILMDYAATKISHTFWFPDMQVKKGDVIYLYTSEKALCSEMQKPGNGSFHELLWNLPSPLESVKPNCLVLVEASDWSFKEIRPPVA